MKKLKILFDFQNMIGGAPRSQLAHMQVMKEHGHGVVATIGNDIGTLKENVDDVKIIKIDNFKLRNPFSIVLSIIKFIKILRANKFDIIHSNRIPQFKFLSIVSDLSQVPLVFVQAGGEANISNIKIMKGKTPIVYSLENKTSFIEAGFANEKIHVISNRIALNKWPNRTKKYNIGTEKLKILLISNVKEDTINGIMKFLYHFSNNFKKFDTPFLVQIAGKDITPGRIYHEKISNRIREVNSLIEPVGCIEQLGWVDQIETLQAESDICIGKGRSIIQPAMKGEICFVLAESGRLTRINRLNFDNLYEYNFSGRGDQVDNTDEFLELLNKPDRFEVFFQEALASQNIVQKAYLKEYAYEKLLNAYKDAIGSNRHSKFFAAVDGFWRFVKIYHLFLLQSYKKLKTDRRMNIKNAVPTFLKLFIKILLVDLFRIGRYGWNWCKNSNDLIILSDKNNPTFFGYHDKTPFSSDGSKILAMSITASDTKAESECTQMKLGFFSKDAAGFENNLITFAETTTWCWQQGCMLQWHPLVPNRHVVFNVLVEGAYGSVVYDIENRSAVKQYKHPVYSIDPTGKLAATLNFSRLGRLRPGYGYGLIPDSSASVFAPEDDGLFVFDLVTGEKRLLVSLADLAVTAGDPHSQHYINHATFSPDGQRVIFFHLWALPGDSGRGLRVCEVDPLSGVWCEVESNRIVSHYCWKDKDCFLATTLNTNGMWHYTMYDRLKNTRNDIALCLKEDGHPMFHPHDKKIIITDTYPDKRRDQHLCVVDLKSKNVIEKATLYSPVRFRKQVRCDLHPRWDRVGEYIVVDTTLLGKRTIALVMYC